MRVYIGTATWSVAFLLGLVVVLSGLGCGPGEPGDSQGNALAADAGEGSDALAENEETAPVPSEILAAASEAWTGDFDEMVERRYIRALVVYNSTNFFFDEQAQPRGISHEALKIFEETINKELGTGLLKVHVVAIPVRRDMLIPELVNGYGDIALGNLTITDERRQQVDFSIPAYSGVNEIVVTGPGAPPLSTLEDLSGREVWVRASSSYFESLEQLNRSFAEQGLEPVIIKKAAEQLETEAILEMVAAEAFDITIADEHLAEAWAETLSGLTLHRDLKVRTDGEIAWMFRHDSPKLAAKVNAFIKENRKGTLLGNMLFKRYYVNSKWINNPTSRNDVARLKSMVDLFKGYADQYDFDWLLIAAQGYQESTLDQSKRSHAGAIGVMQLLQSTAADPNVNIPDIENLESNIHAGNKYMRFILDHYFGDAEMDVLNKHLFAFASYNAGPNRIARLRKRAAEQGFDPNVWFQNVEVVVAKEVGREPVQYVSNIFKYYVAYSLAREQMGL